MLSEIPIIIGCENKYVRNTIPSFIASEEVITWDVKSDLEKGISEVCFLVNPSLSACVKSVICKINYFIVNYTREKTRNS